jgi:TPR repeat protein
LADKYDKGLGVSQSYSEAAKWYRLAAKQSDPKGQNNLGTMYEQGQGVSQDRVRAYMWIYLSAKSGMKDAIRNIAALDKVIAPSQKQKAIEMAEQCATNRFDNCD